MNFRFHMVAVATLAVLSRFELASAQVGVTTQGELRGRVVSGASARPIAGASVDVRSGADSASVTRATTDADGGFRVPGLRAGRYRVVVRALGHAPRTLPSVVIGTASPVMDVGTVTLTPVALEIKAVVVNEQRRDVQLAPDRNTYVVRDMPTTSGGNALDVLRNVPAVDVDIDNVVSLRGHAGVVVQINGRPSPMKPGQLGNFLAQLPAAMVDKIEVVPNPSARDDPTGVAGIINIVLKKETNAGTSGGLTLSAGTTGRVDAGGNAGYQSGPVSMYGSYGFLRDNRPRNEQIYRENLYLHPLTYLEESAARTQVPLAHTFTGSLEYKPGKHDELSAELLFSTRSEAETTTILYRDLDAARAVTSLRDRVRRGTNNEFNLESTLAYTHTFAAEGHELSGEVRAFRAREGGPDRYTARTLAFDGTPRGSAALEDATGYERPNETAVKVDYKRELTSAVRMEGGYKGSLETFHTTLDTRVFDTLRTAFFPDTSRISDFTYDQMVHAAYGQLNARVGRFALQGGLRVERATTQFHLNTRGATFDNDYNSAFPSGLVAYEIDESHQVKLSYSTRIRRPDDTDQIDPTIHFQDPLNVSRGNPNLRPEYIRAVELGLQRTSDHMTVQLTPFFRHTLDAVRTLRSIDTAGVTTRTFANIATADAYGADATVALSGGRLGGFAGASAYRQVSDVSNLDPTLSARSFGWTARANASFRVSKSQDLQGLFFYHAPMTVEQGRSSSRARFSLAARQKLSNDRLSVTVRVIDPFRLSHDRFTTIDPRFYQVSDRTRAERALLLSVNWAFGKPPKKGKDQIDLGGGDAGPP